MKATIFAIPAAIAATVLAVFGLAQLPIERIGAARKPDPQPLLSPRPVEPLTPKPHPAVVSNLPVSQRPGINTSFSGDPPKPTKPAASKLKQEASLYQREITHLRSLSKISLDGGKQLMDMGGLEQADRQFKNASHHAETASCLENQLRLNVPFYQGKATCAAALPRPAT